MKKLEDLKVQIFADGADRAGMIDLYNNPLIKGLTTNPTLMKKAGIRNYESFARDILEVVKTKPISFEVFSDDFKEMRREAEKISKWQNNVFVKIPITNTKGDSSANLIKDLASEGVQLNVTAILTLDQVNEVAQVLQESVPSVVSVFAGRVADTGTDPIPLMKASQALLDHLPKAELLWASVREVVNIFEADRCGCDIITVPHDILAKAIKIVGYDHKKLSLETVQMFHHDSLEVGYSL